MKLRTVLTGLLILGVCAGGVMVASPTLMANESAENAEPREEQIEQLIHERINQQRTKRGLTELSFDTQLEEVAAYHNDDMVKNEYYAHESPSGETVTDRYQRFDYSCTVETDSGTVRSGENIFRLTYSDTRMSNKEIATAAVSNWMNSPGHRENILRGYWTTEGVDVEIESEGDSTVVYVTQNFC